MSKPSKKFWRSFTKSLALALILSGFTLFSLSPVAAQDDIDLSDLFSEEPEDFGPNSTGPSSTGSSLTDQGPTDQGPPGTPSPASVPTSARPPLRPALPATLPTVAPPPPIPPAAPGTLPPANAPAPASSPYELTVSPSDTQAQSLDDNNDEGILADPFGDPPEAPRDSGPLDAELTLPPAVPAEASEPSDPSPSPELANLPSEAEPSYSNFQGQVITPPPPPWQRASRDTVGTPSASGPLPDFDTSQGRWQQMEIGQFDRPRNAQPLRANDNQSGSDDAVAPSLQASANDPTDPFNPAVSQISQTAQALEANGAPSAAPAAAPPAAPPPASQNDPVRELFSDLLPETPEPLAPQAPPRTSSASVSGSLSPPSSSQSSINELFSDFSMTDVPSNQAIDQNQAAQSSAAPGPANSAAQTGPASNSLSLPLSPPPVAPSLPLVPPLPAEPRSLALSPPAVDQPSSIPPEASSLPDPADDSANLAIARAGSLLMEEGLRPKVSSATILEPGGPPAKRPSNSKDQSTASKTTAKATTKAKTTAKSQSSTPKSGTSSGTKAAKAQAPAAPRPNLSVILVNETGRANVGEDYRMVLSRMGYQVVSVTERGPSGAGGQTVITYQSGQQSQARALARRLPGPRQLVASREPLPAQAVIVIR